MTATLASLCETLRSHGMDPKPEGDSATEIRAVATLEDAGDGDVSFLSNPKYEKMLASTRASAVVLGVEIPAPAGMNLIRIADPYAAITALIIHLHGYRKHRAPQAKPDAVWISPTARLGKNCQIYPGVTIDDGVTIGDEAVIYPGCYVGPRCRIGSKLTLFPNVVLYDGTIIGDRCTIHANSVIGEDGLGYAPVNGKWLKIPQIGWVELGDDVEIGACCAIDRATLGRTSIGSGTKFSNLIAIGHGTHIGEHCLFVAQVGLAGSVQVGDRVTMAGQAGVVGHIRIGDKATIGAKAGVTNNVADGQTVLGQPAIPIQEMRRQVVHIAKLPAMRDQVRGLEKENAQLAARVEELEQRLAQLAAHVGQSASA